MELYNIDTKVSRAENSTAQIFSYNEEKIRTQLIDAEPHFALVDVCKILEVSNPSDVARRLDDDEYTTLDLIEGGKIIYINESGLYSTILSSRKKSAKVFKKWVTSEVLPAIRKKGVYSTQSLSRIDLANLIIEAEHERMRAEAVAHELQGRVQEMTPKAEVYDQLVDRNGLENLRDTAALLGMRQSDFIIALEANGYCYRNTAGELRYYAEYAKYFAYKEWAQNGRTGKQLMTTFSGRAFFARKFRAKTETFEVTNVNEAWV